jgi:glycosyltransferase involved in cell wall biosynthesis
MNTINYQNSNLKYRKVKVCMVSYSKYESDNRILRVSRYLVDADNEVDVLNLSDLYRKKRQSEKIRVYKVQDRKKDELTQFDYMFRIIKFFLLTMIKLSVLQFKRKYDFIHVHNLPDFLVFAAIIPKIFGAKVILDIHDLMPEFYCQKFNTAKNCIMYKFLYLIHMLSVKFSDHIIIANHLWRDDLIKNGIPEEKCTVILNTPDREIFNKTNLDSYQSKDGQFILVYHGTLSWIHGVDIAIQALALVKHQIPQIRLYIYGEGHATDELLNLVKSLDLNNHVMIHKRIPIEKIPEKLSMADIGIVPKRSGIFSSKAFSTKILEYFATGIPVMASKTTIDAYYFDSSNILFFEPENPDDLAEKIIETYKNRNRLSTLIKNAFRFLEKHSWTEYERQYYKIIHNDDNIKHAETVNYTELGKYNI